MKPTLTIISDSVQQITPDQTTVSSGTEYGIRIDNPTDKELLAHVQVDGRVISGNGFLVPAKDYITFERPVTSDKKFKAVFGGSTFTGPETGKIRVVFHEVDKTPVQYDPLLDFPYPNSPPFPINNPFHPMYPGNNKYKRFFPGVNEFYCTDVPGGPLAARGATTDAKTVEGSQSDQVFGTVTRTKIKNEIFATVHHSLKVTLSNKELQEYNGSLDEKVKELEKEFLRKKENIEKMKL